ncbi:MAG: hypothetical protein ACRYG4_15270, partial [Janthinobacterium lividum]
MQSSLVAAVAAALLVVPPVAAQERPVRAEPVSGTEVTPDRASRTSPGRAAASADQDEPGRGDRTNTQPAGDPRAERARSAKLSDLDIASAPIYETRSVTRHTALIGGRQIA